MRKFPSPLDLKRIKVQPLAQRRSLSSIERILIDPGSPPPDCSAELPALIRDCAKQIIAARERKAGVILMFGAHLVKNGTHRIVNELVDRGFITHLATNGAGVIHDWELAFLGRTEERVRENVATGTFGTWDETGRFIHFAILNGARYAEGYGQSVGRFIEEDGVNLPEPASLEKELRDAPSHPLAPARAELLRVMVAHKVPAGRVSAKHPWKETSLLAHAFRLRLSRRGHWSRGGH